MLYNQMSIASKLIAKPDGVTEVIHQNTGTHGIIDVIILAMKRNKPYTSKFAEHLRGSDDYETLYNVWHWVKKNIRYKVDKPGFENVKSPAVTFKDGFADCKSMSILVSSLLKNLKIPHVFRFAAYGKGDVTHVYVVALLDDGDVIMDTVVGKFDYEEPYHHAVQYVESQYYQFI